MAVNTYQNAASGNPTNLYLKAELLAAADAVQVVDKFVKAELVPKNKNETVAFQRAVTPDVDTTESAEGVSKASRKITFETVSVRMQEFAESFAFSSRQANFGETDILAASKDRLTDLYRRTREKNGWFTFRNANNVFYNSSAITSRGAVNGRISLNLLHKADRLLLDNRARHFYEMSKGSTNNDTYPVEACYPVLCHTACRSDIRALPGFIPHAKVGGAMPMPVECFGHVENFAFFCSPEFDPRLAAGAPVGATGMKSVGGANVDVYTYLILGKEALGRIALAGSDGAGGIGAGGTSYTVLDKAEKSDPDNRTRIVVTNWNDGPIILNQNWVVALEVGVSDLAN